MPTYDAKCTTCPFEDEIEKPREAPLPACPECGGTLKRVYHTPTLHYAAAGFSATDGRLEKVVGKKRYAKFADRKADIDARPRRGQLTEYERAVEAVQVLWN